MTSASISRDMLGTNRVAVDDGFVHLGCDSLVAVKMLARVRHVFGIVFCLVFEQSTICELARAVTAELLGEANSDDLAQMLAATKASEG